MSDTGGVARVLEDARTAHAEYRWGDAYRLLSTLAVDDLDVDDLDRLGTAAYLTGHDEDGFAVWVRAHQRCIDDNAVHRAAYFGMRLAQGLGFKGDLGRCRGWVDRTARLLDLADIDCVEQGYLEHGLAMMRIFEAGDLAGAHSHFVQAGKIGTRFAQRELVTLARIGEGRMLIYLAEIAEGMALLDEAMVSIEARELSPLAAGDAYCMVIDACSELVDVRRCRAWTESFRTLVRHATGARALSRSLLPAPSRGARTRGFVARGAGRSAPRLRPAGRPGQPGGAGRRLGHRGRSAPPRRRVRQCGNRLHARARVRL